MSSTRRRNRTGYNGQVAKLDCRVCGRAGCTVMSDFTLLAHGRDYCAGPDPEQTFTDLLGLAGLDVRRCCR